MKHFSGYLATTITLNILTTRWLEIPGAGYKVKHNNFVSCEHLSTHNSKAEKSILHLVTATETAAVIQKVTKQDNITQKNETEMMMIIIIMSFVFSLKT